MKRSTLPADLATAWRQCLPKVQWQPTGCWEWQGCKSKGGYGRARTTCGVRLVHVISYAHHCGRLNPDLVVAHLCHNQACCNPVHLQLITQKENVRQSIERGTFHYNPAKRKVPVECHARIRSLCRQTGVSRQQLADEYGVSVSLIEKILYSSQRGQTH